MNEPIRLDSWEKKHMAAGYNLHVYLAVSELLSYLSPDEFLIYKGAALAPSVYNKNGFLRIFGDIDVVLLNDELIKKLKATDLYSTNSGKFLKKRKTFEIDMKFTYDIKVGDTIEGLVSRKRLFERSKLYMLEDISFRIPSIEDSILLVLAHKIKHDHNGDNRCHWVEDLVLMKNLPLDSKYLLNAAQEFSLLHEMEALLNVQSI